MPLRSIIHDVWIGSIGLQVLLAFIVLAKRTWQRYPFFSAYVLFNLFETAILYSVFRMTKVYMYTFLLCEAIGIVLGLAIVREIFTNVFSPHPALRKLATMIFRVGVIALIVLGCGVIYAQSGDVRGIFHVMLLAEQATRIVEVGLIMFLFLSSSAFGLHWKQNVFGIALGLGMFAAVELINVTLIGHVSTTTAQAFSLVRSISYSASLMMWAGYLLVPEQMANTAEIPKRAQLEQWNQAVMELISR
jgi:hypothetical protein